MASNSTYIAAVCNYTLVGDVLNAAVKHNLSVAEIVRQCDGICALAWGIGNPDLSGVGAYISYICQAVLTILFGPMYILFLPIKFFKSPFKEVVEQTPHPKEPVSTKYRIAFHNIDKVRAIQRQFCDTSALFSIPVAVATLVRLRQGATIFEMAFMQPLMAMQFLGSISNAIARLMSYFWFQEAGLSERRSGRRYRRYLQKIRPFIIPVFYSIIHTALFVAYQTRSTSMCSTTAALSATQDLFSACSVYNGVVPEIGDSTSGFILVVAWILVVVTVTGLSPLMVLMAARYPPWAVLAPLGLCGGVLYCMVDMHRKRETIQALVGIEYQDNEWGFGQVLAVFLWAPFIISWIDIMLKRKSNREQDERTDETPPVYGIMVENIGAFIEAMHAGVANIENEQKHEGDPEADASGVEEGSSETTTGIDEQVERYMKMTQSLMLGV
ncbi:hypothetical protein EJ08DRAFT_651458 [Tothia fuscella]|uniref:Uncharacterized protein n=1 Tax=Tothia fuscella TaxID=1048955 RepID=A0A9P4TW13_9PEZI|nr:hypothetical protein EJ08DRAFT_651458 [Tothia fuscella]